MVPSLPCCPVNRHCLWRKPWYIEKNLLVTTGYLVHTSGYLVVTSVNLTTTTGYFWLLLVTSRWQEHQHLSFKFVIETIDHYCMLEKSFIWLTKVWFHRMFRSEQGEILLKFNILHLHYLTHYWARIECQPF